MEFMKTAIKGIEEENLDQIRNSSCINRNSDVSFAPSTFILVNKD